MFSTTELLGLTPRRVPLRGGVLEIMVGRSVFHKVSFEFKIELESTQNLYIYTLILICIYIYIVRKRPHIKRHSEIVSTFCSLDSPDIGCACDVM